MTSDNLNTEVKGTYKIVYIPSSRWALPGRFPTIQSAFDSVVDKPSDMLIIEGWPSGKAVAAWYGENVEN